MTSPSNFITQTTNPAESLISPENLLTPAQQGRLDTPLNIDEIINRAANVSRMFSF